MPKDTRYDQIKILYEAGYYKQFRDVFATVPKSVVAKDLGMNNIRFTGLIEQPDLFILKDIFRLAALFDMKEETVLIWIQAQRVADKKVGRKKK